MSASRQRSSKAKAKAKTKAELEADTVSSLKDIMAELGIATLPGVSYMPTNWYKSTQAKRMTTTMASASSAFIESTKGQNNEATHAVTNQLIAEMRERGLTVKDEKDIELVPCFASGKLVPIASLQADHASAQEKIMKKIDDVVTRLNTDPKYRDKIAKIPNAEYFFVGIKDKNSKNKKYTKCAASQFLCDIYYNDINNIWLISGYVNLNKSNSDFMAWIQNKWTYGQAFIDYVNSKNGIQTDGLAQKIDGEGLAKVAIDWFLENQQAYLDNTLKMQEAVINPLMDTNRAAALAVADNEPRLGEFRAAAASYAIKAAATTVEVMRKILPRYSHEPSSDEELDSGDDEDLSSTIANNLIRSVVETIPPKASRAATPTAHKRRLGRSETLAASIEDGEDSHPTFLPIDGNQPPLSGKLPVSDSSIILHVHAANNPTDSGLAVLGIDSRTAISQLKGIEDVDSRRLVANEIRVLMESGNNPNSDYQNILDAYKNKIAYIQDVLPIQFPQYKGVDLQILLKTNNSPELDTYRFLFNNAINVKYTELDKLYKSDQALNWYGELLVQKTIGLSGNMLLLLARERHCNLYIWGEKANVPNANVPNAHGAKYYTFNPGNQMTLHVHETDGPYKFNYLIDRNTPKNDFDDTQVVDIHKTQEHFLPIQPEVRTEMPVPIIPVPSSQLHHNLSSQTNGQISSVNDNAKNKGTKRKMGAESDNSTAEPDNSANDSNKTQETNNISKRHANEQGVLINRSASSASSEASSSSSAPPINRPIYVAPNPALTGADLRQIANQYTQSNTTPNNENDSHSPRHF